MHQYDQYMQLNPLLEVLHQLVIPSKYLINYIVSLACTQLYIEKNSSLLRGQLSDLQENTKYQVQRIKLLRRTKIHVMV
jgi:hypothetical protein